MNIREITAAAGRLCRRTRAGGFYFLSVDDATALIRRMPARMAPVARSLVKRLSSMPHHVRRIGALTEAIEAVGRIGEMARLHSERACLEREVARTRRAVVLQILTEKAGTLLGAVS